MWTEGHSPGVVRHDPGTGKTLELVRPRRDGALFSASATPLGCGRGPARSRQRSPHREQHRHGARLPPATRDGLCPAQRHAAGARGVGGHAPGVPARTTAAPARCSARGGTAICLALGRDPQGCCRGQAGSSGHRQGRALSSPRATPQGVADGDRPAPGIATGARARCSTGRTREVRAPSQRQHHRVRGVRSDARGIGSARPGRALGSGGDRGSVRRPGDRAPAARTSRDRLDRHRYDFHARQATRTKQPPDPVLVGLSLLGLVEPTSLTLNLRMRTEGHAPWGRWERPAVHFGPLSTERQA